MSDTKPSTPEYRTISSLHNWERNDLGRFMKGSVSPMKGTGMTKEQKELVRKETLKKYNNKPDRIEKVKQWHLDHKDRVHDIKTKYAKSPRGMIKRKEQSHKRIALERNLQKKINMEYWVWLCKALKYHCVGCYKQFTLDTLTIDHWLPINRGGDNDEWNLQPLCKSCNSRKQDRIMYVDEWVVDYAYGYWLEHKKYGYNS